MIDWLERNGLLAHLRIADLFIDELARPIAILIICPFSASSVNKCRARDASRCHNGAQVSTFYRALEYDILFIIARS